jgi:hypothetical protein
VPQAVRCTGAGAPTAPSLDSRSASTRTWARALASLTKGQAWMRPTDRCPSAPSFREANRGSPSARSWAFRNRSSSPGRSWSPAERNTVVTGRPGFVRLGSTSASRRTSAARRASTAETRPPGAHSVRSSGPSRSVAVAAMTALTASGVRASGGCQRFSVPRPRPRAWAAAAPARL